MDVNLVIHFDEVENWWGELTDVPGFTASAPTLRELREVVESCLPDIESDLGTTLTIVSEVLADPDREPAPFPPSTIEILEATSSGRESAVVTQGVGPVLVRHVPAAV